MNKLLKLKYIILITLLVLISTILYSYDERISDKDDLNNGFTEDSGDETEIIDDNRNIDDNEPINNIEEETTEISGTDTETDKDNQSEDNIDEELSEVINEENNNNDRSNNVKENNGNEDIAKDENKEKIQVDPRTYYIDLNAEYYREKEYDISLENIVFREKISNNSLLNGSNLLYSFYKIERFDNNKIKRIYKFGTYFSLEEFQDYIYKDNYLTKILTYDNMANILGEEIRKYNNLGYMVNRKIENKESNIKNEYLYDYDVNGNEIIRIHKRFNENYEIRYSYYNPSDQLIRREYYRFGRIERTILYDYSYDYIHQKRVYNSRGEYLRTYRFRESDKADKILRNELPGFID